MFLFWLSARKEERRHLHNLPLLSVIDRTFLITVVFKYLSVFICGSGCLVTNPGQY